MIASDTKRPRNVDWKSAAAILYGDWGTSKAYVVGLAFAVAGYSSFWLIAAMCTLTALVGVNYMTICKHYPDGGGVYASVRHRSQIISIVGAFLLVADYIVTAALSALSAFQYLGQVFHMPHLELFAAGAILVIGALNFLGPKHTGSMAFWISVPTAIVVLLLGLFCLPHASEALHNMRPLEGGFGTNWKGFVGIVLALSGVEAIANATGVMPLNPGCDPNKPCVSKTSTKALIIVMIEVCAFTALLGFGMQALHGLTIVPDPNPALVGDVNGPGASGVRDYMLNYMAKIFVSGSFGVTAGAIAAAVVSFVFAFLLLSAVNTAIVDLIAISFLMARDKELPITFQKLNTHGVPNAGLIVATVIPAILVVVVRDMAGLADLYAVGVVGAIATNLGASSTDKKLNLLRWERYLMFFTFLIMVAIEISLFATKPNARLFALIVLAIGLIMRGLASEHVQRKESASALAGGSHSGAGTDPQVPSGSGPRYRFSDPVRRARHWANAQIRRRGSARNQAPALFALRPPATCPQRTGSQAEVDGRSRCLADLHRGERDGRRTYHPAVLCGERLAGRHHRGYRGHRRGLSRHPRRREEKRTHQCVARQPHSAGFGTAARRHPTARLLLGNPNYYARRSEQGTRLTFPNTRGNKAPTISRKPTLL